MGTNLKRRKFVQAAVAAGAATAFAADALLSGARAGPAQHMVEIHKFKFSPASLNAKPGDTITWINKDIVPHTATASDESWDTGKIEKGERKRIVVGADFQENYYCRFHRTMKGTVVTAG